MINDQVGVRLRSVAGRMRRGVWIRLGERSVEERMIWVLGSPRSGSTWLLRMLGDHPEVVAVNEPLIGWFLGPFLSDLPGWDSSVLDISNFTMRRMQAEKADQFFATEFSDVWSPALGKMMRRRFAAHSVRHPPERGSASKAVIAIQEPNGSQSADVLMRSLPRSRFVFLLRDGRDVVDSELAANLSGSWLERAFPGSRGLPEERRLEFVRQSARRWLWRTQVVQQAYEQHPGPRKLIRYEELLADPLAHLETLLEWMGKDLSKPELSAITDRHAFERMPQSERGEKGFYRAASPGLWRENLSADEQAAVHEIIGSQLVELGYETA